MGDPSQSVFNAQLFSFAPSQIWRTATLRMPKGKDFDGLGF
ncbi:MAG: hypothetical protein JW395_3871 [Nitrospira sp.]|nr:hypothetical protein [Nitrospira sp.]